MRKILVVSVNWLGDVVFSAPIYAALKVKYPSAKISVLAVPRVKEVLALCPGVDEIIIYDEKGDDRPLLNKLFVCLRLKKAGFDAVFFPRKSISRSLLAFFAGIPSRIGYADGWARRLLTLALPVEPEHLDRLHRRDVYLRAIERAGIEVSDRTCRIEVPLAVRAGMDARLKARGVSEQDIVVAIHTGGNWGSKQWPADNFVELIRQIEARAKARVVLTGGMQDVERVLHIAGMSGGKALVFAGETAIEELAALFARAKVVVSADSGPLHLASASGSAVVALFGPTRPEITGPVGGGKSCVIQKDVGCNRGPCYHLGCQDNRCMKAITVDDVFEKIRSITG